MKSDGIGLFLLMVGFVAVGTLILFLFYRLVAGLVKRITGRKPLSSANSPPITPHIVVVAFLVVCVLFIGFPEVDDIGGPTAAGGTFDLTFDAKTEIHLMITLGTSYHFTPAWSATFAARFEHHFMDITITDRVSGATTTLDSQSPIGAYLSINYGF